MPETSKLDKMIAHRQQQSRKNDKLRIHKNKLENGRLEVQTSYYDWNKKLRNREFELLEIDYVKKLEKIYDRQLQVEEARIKREENEKSDDEWSSGGEFMETGKDQTTKATTPERDTKKRVRKEAAERSRSFMSKARSLSGCYRDNDPPPTYYKRNGIVPPDRNVAPEVSANAQMSYGGGWRPPPSSDHPGRLPSETAYGVVENPRRVSSSRSRLPSAQSRQSGHGPMTSSDYDVEESLIDEVIKVQVNVRPSTAPIKRDIPGSGIVTQQYERDDESIKGEYANDDVMMTKQKIRPSTAVAAVHFLGPQEESVERVEGFSPVPRQRRASLRTPNLLMFRRRNGDSPNVGNRSSGGRRGGAPGMMSGTEKERIRRKMEEKSRCLERERYRRRFLGSMTSRSDVRAKQRSVSSRDHFGFENFARLKEKEAVASPRVVAHKSSSEGQAMLGYIEKVERGLIIADNFEARKMLLKLAQKELHGLQGNVDQFARTKS